MGSNRSLGLQGGKNRRRGKNENDDEKRELVFKEEGQGELDLEKASSR
jgi:translation initiation factor 1A